MYLKTCWSPFYWHPNVKSGSYAVALYTGLLSICLISYTANILNGGDSSQFYLPLFESGLGKTQDSVISGAVFIIIFFVFFALSSGLLVFGLRSDIRGLMLPWMVGMAAVVLFQATFGLWLIFGYYIYLESVFAALVCWAWMAYNIYCYYVVRSHFTNVKWFQSPDIQVLDQYAN